MTDPKRIGDYSKSTLIMEFGQCQPDRNIGFTAADGKRIHDEPAVTDDEKEKNHTYIEDVKRGKKEYPIAYLDARRYFASKDTKAEMTDFMSSTKTHKDDQWYAVEEKPIGEGSDKFQLTVPLELAEWLLPNFGDMDEESRSICYATGASGEKVLVVSGALLITDGPIDRAFDPERVPLALKAEQFRGVVKEAPVALTAAELAAHEEFVPLTDRARNPLLISDAEALAIVGAAASAEAGNVDKPLEKFRPLAVAPALDGRPGGAKLDWDLEAARHAGAGALRYWYVNAKAIKPEQWQLITESISKIFTEKNTNVRRVRLLSDAINRVAKLAGEPLASTVDNATVYAFHDDAREKAGSFLADVLKFSPLVTIVQKEISTAEKISMADALPKAKALLTTKLHNDGGLELLDYVAEHLEQLLPRVAPAKFEEHLDPNYSASNSVPRRMIAYFLLMGREQLTTSTKDTDSNPVMRLMGVTGAAEFIIQVHKKANLFDFFIDHFNSVAAKSIKSAGGKIVPKDEIAQMWQPLYDAKRTVMDETRDAKAKADQDGRDATMKTDNDERDAKNTSEGRWMTVWNTLGSLLVFIVVPKVFEFAKGFVNPLGKYAENLSKAAAKGELKQTNLDVRAKEVSEVVRIILAGYCPILLGVPGVGKTEIIQGLVWALHEAAKGNFSGLSQKELATRIQLFLDKNPTIFKADLAELSGEGGIIGSLERIVGRIFKQMVAKKAKGKLPAPLRIPFVWRWFSPNAKPGIVQRALTTGIRFFFTLHMPQGKGFTASVARTAKGVLYPAIAVVRAPTWVLQKSGAFLRDHVPFVSRLVAALSGHGTLPILFGDETHTFTSMGQGSEIGSGRATNVAKLFLPKKAQMIGGSTQDEWAGSRRADAAFVSRFIPVYVYNAYTDTKDEAVCAAEMLAKKGAQYGASTDHAPQMNFKDARVFYLVARLAWEHREQFHANNFGNKIFYEGVARRADMLMGEVVQWKRDHVIAAAGLDVSQLGKAGLRKAIKKLAPQMSTLTPADVDAFARDKGFSEVPTQLPVELSRPRDIFDPRSEGYAAYAGEGAQPSAETPSDGGDTGAPAEAKLPARKATAVATTAAAAKPGQIFSEATDASSVSDAVGAFGLEPRFFSALSPLDAAAIEQLASHGGDRPTIRRLIDGGLSLEEAVTDLTSGVTNVRGLQDRVRAHFDYDAGQELQRLGFAQPQLQLMHDAVLSGASSLTAVQHLVAAGFSPATIYRAHVQGVRLGSLVEQIEDLGRATNDVASEIDAEPMPASRVVEEFGLDATLFSDLHLGDAEAVLELHARGMHEATIRDLLDAGISADAILSRIEGGESIAEISGVVREVFVERVQKQLRGTRYARELETAIWDGKCSLTAVQKLATAGFSPKVINKAFASGINLSGLLNRVVFGQTVKEISRAVLQDEAPAVAGTTAEEVLRGYGLEPALFQLSSADIAAVLELQRRGVAPEAIRFVLDNEMSPEAKLQRLNQLGGNTNALLQELVSSAHATLPAYFRERGFDAKFVRLVSEQGISIREINYLLAYRLSPTAIAIAVQRDIALANVIAHVSEHGVESAQAELERANQTAPAPGGTAGDGGTNAGGPTRGSGTPPATGAAFTIEKVAPLDLQHPADPLSIPLAELDAQLARSGDTMLQAKPITSAAQAALFAERGGLNVMQIMNDEVAARRGEKTGGGFSLLESARVALSRASDVGSEMSRWIRSAAESGWIKPEGKVAEWFDAVVPRARRMMEVEAVR